MVKVKLFATLREVAGTDEIDLSPAAAKSVRALREELCRRHPAMADAFGTQVVLSAVNHKYAAPDDPVSDGDEVAFFPTVSGG